MNTRSLSILLAVALVGGCSDSSDSSKGEEPGKKPAEMKPSENDEPQVADDEEEPAADDEPATGDDEPVGGEAGAAGSDDEMTDPGTGGPNENGEYPDIRGVGCSVDSGFPGDEVCLAPPPEGEGMQLHVGPSDYNDPDEINKFIFHPGQETSACWTVHTPNTEEIYYQGSVLSGRPGTHHIINTGYLPEVQIADGGFTVCMGGGTGTSSNTFGALPGASKSYMPRRPTAPENEHLGKPIPANAPMQADMHYFNFTDKDILREFWLNLYFIDKDDVQETPIQVRGMGGFGWAITPGTDHVYQYTAPITADGRIIELLGHYHAHGKRFTAYILRGDTGKQEKVFEMYNYLDPLIFDYNSVVENPEFSDTMGGAVSGILEVKAGDTLQWECHIVNDSMVTLRYTNMVNTGEMCNIWGATVGPKIDKLSAAEIPFEIQ